ncbi:MAG: hypothetical protein ACRD4E_10240 [Bryobacteraceae bacterium]
MTNHCPFCGNYAYASSVGDAYQMDCRYCEIQVEITKRAYAARCPDPVAVLDYIRERLKTSTRPRVDLKDMKRLRQPPITSKPEEQMTATDTDALTTAAKAIGTTLGKIAVKTGIAKPPAAEPTVVKKAPTAKKVAAKKTLAKKTGVRVKRKAAPKTAAAKRK